MTSAPVVVLSGAKVREGMEGKEAEVTAELNAILHQIPGYISTKEYVAADGETLSVFTFESDDALVRWRDEASHVAYQRVTDDYYESFWVQAAQVYRSYVWRDGKRTDTHSPMDS